MKLKTDIKPRRDGTVKAHTPNAIYTFVEEGGALVCEVENEVDAGFLLETGNFYPDEGDHQIGIEAINLHVANAQPSIEKVAQQTISVGNKQRRRK